MDNMITLSAHSKTCKAQILSQKFTQLSLAAANNQSTIINNIETKISTIPGFLTKRHKSFQQILFQILSIIRTTTTTKRSAHAQEIEELREIAILIYRTKIIQIYHRLWSTYLQSGTGQLDITSTIKLSYSTTLSIWPKQTTALCNIDKSNIGDENEIYLKFVNSQLDQLNQQLEQSQNDLDLKTKHFPGYILTGQNIIETYIEKNFQSFRLKINHEIELIHYDYHIRALKLEYLRHNPSQYQEQLMNDVCQSKYTLESTEQEHQLLKQQITYYNSPSQSFDFSLVAQSLSNDSSAIRDEQMQQEYYQKCKVLAEECRANLFDMYMQDFEDRRMQYKQKYEAHVKKIFSTQHQSLNIQNESKLSPIMIELIEQRCQIISERIRSIYKFKAELVLLEEEEK